MDIEYFNGIKLLSGRGHNPGSGTPNAHKQEYLEFQKVLERITNKKSPLMIELGSYWALWSLCFRKKFPNGKNIIVEFGKRQLETGKTNFEINGFDCSSYWGSIFLESEFGRLIKDEDSKGKDLDLLEIIDKEDVEYIDILHMDIQGSEGKVIEYLIETKMITNIQEFVIATHSKELHSFIYDSLSDNGYDIKLNINFNNGMDGMIHASQLNTNK